MKKIFWLIPLLVIFFACTNPSKEKIDSSLSSIPSKFIPNDSTICFTDFNQLHDVHSKINFKKLELKPQILQTKNFPKPYCGLVNIWLLNEEFGIKHYHPSRDAMNYTTPFVKDTLEILGFKKSLDDILNTQSPIFHIAEIKYFQFYSSTYLLLSIEYNDKGCIGFRWVSHYALLVDISNKEKISLISLGEINRYYPNYLGDFNHDKNLDYINSCNFSVYTIRNNNLFPHNTLSLNIELCTENQNQPKSWYELNRWYEINTYKSKWPIPILPHKQDSCYCYSEIEEEKEAPNNYTDFFSHALKQEDYCDSMERVTNRDRQKIN